MASRNSLEFIVIYILIPAFYFYSFSRFLYSQIWNHISNFLRSKRMGWRGMKLGRFMEPCWWVIVYLIKKWCLYPLETGYKTTYLHCAAGQCIYAHIFNYTIWMLKFVMCPCQSIYGVEMRFRSSITDGPANVVPTESSPLHMLREPIAPAPSGDSKRGPSTPSPAPAAEIENARVIVGISTRFGTMTWILGIFWYPCLSCLAKAFSPSFHLLRCHCFCDPMREVCFIRMLNKSWWNQVFRAQNLVKSHRRFDSKFLFN